MNGLRQDAQLLCGEVFGGQILCPGPGHRKDDRSLCLRPSTMAAIGYTFHSFAGDDPIDCLDHIRACLGLPGFAPSKGKRPQRKEFVAKAETPAPDHSSDAAKIWNSAEDIRGSIAEKYLNSRGLHLDGGIDWRRILRFEPACAFEGYYVPAMVSLFRDILTDKAVAIHRTFLTAGAVKIERKVLGPTAGAAIKIDKLGSSNVLSIGEGIESTLSGRCMGFFPAWCVGSAGSIGAFPCLPGVDLLRVFTEHDANGVNEKALQKCVDRWRDAGRKVLAVRPENGFGDLNDELMCLTPEARSFAAACREFWPEAQLCQE